MLDFIVFTILPDLIKTFTAQSLIKKGIDKQKFSIKTVNFRDFGIGKHHKVDDTPYGGGAGMLLRPEPIIDAIEDVEKKLTGKQLYKILISPQGEPFKQKKAISLSKLDATIGLICGRFEGFDERIRDFVDEEISIGDYILLGGEIPAMAIIEAVSRLVPGVVGNDDSLVDESFQADLLEYAQYTKPLNFRDKVVPEVLISGHHQKIKEWRQACSISRTRKNRSDLYQLFINSQHKND
ncbi:MAG: tRNA (guanosine(37)-N1)-methyltransferase TrmD [Deltaproteobacteria bacterium]|nr:tRNA (guanosine(37)-N1)-methyltransferase TrmD [Deltaproteobacteria bacterium]